MYNYFLFPSLAGDYVKFGFPMAYSITVLAYGGITFKDGYVDAGQFENLLDALKWGTDFFIKAHPEKYVLYGQVKEQCTIREKTSSSNNSRLAVLCGKLPEPVLKITF